MIGKKNILIEFPTQEFLNPNAFSMRAVEALNDRYPELAEWLLYALTHEINIDRINVRFLEGYDMVALIHGIYWYKIHILQHEELCLRFERYNTVWGDSEEGLDDEYTYSSFEHFIETIKASDPSTAKGYHN